MGLLRDNENQKYCIVDCETESLNLLYSRPWQVSWIVVQNKKIIEEHDKFVWWDDLNVSKDAARITRFDYSKYKEKAQSPEEICVLLNHYLYNSEYYIIGQNYLLFDSFQIRNLQKLSKQQCDFSYLPRVYDTLALARAYKLQFNPPKLPCSRNEMLAWQYRMLSIRQKGLKCSLGALCKDFGIDYSTDYSHDSLYDILKTKEVFEQFCYKLEID